MDKKNLQALAENAEKLARQTGWKHAVFRLYPYRSLSAEYRIGELNDAGYRSIGQEIYRTANGRMR